MPSANENKGVFGRVDVLDLPEEVRRRTVEVRVLSVPWWPEALRWWPEKEDFESSAPVLFTTREAAEAELRRVEESEPDLYLKAINGVRAWAAHHGVEEQDAEDFYDEAVSNSEPYRVYGLDVDLLILKLEDAMFSRVVVDGRVMTREDLLL